MPLTPDTTFKINNITVKKFLLTENNTNEISMPEYALPAQPYGVVVYNLKDITTTINTTQAEYYIRQTQKGNMGNLRLHFYVDNTFIWQALPMDLSGWHSMIRECDRSCISVGIIGDDPQTEKIGSILVAWILSEIKQDIDHLYTKNFWVNKRNKVLGTVDYLNIVCNEERKSPEYILPHWGTFKKLVKEKLKIFSMTDFSMNEFLTTAPARINSQNSQNQQNSFLTIAPAGAKLQDKVKDFDKKVCVPAQGEISIFYQVYARKQWLPIVKNSKDQAGIDNFAISALAAHTSQGTLLYRVHQIGSHWFKWVNIHDIYHLNGYAGICGIKIDAIELKLKDLPNFDVRYRVSIKGKGYQPWVYGKEEKFAGRQGWQIDHIQIEIIKEE